MRICVLFFTAHLALGLAATSQAADPVAGEATFRQLCASCHGVSGEADGPASAAMQPQPADMSSPEWQASVDDDHLRTIIRDGGPAVGMSPMMGAWGHALEGDSLEDVIAFIRSLDD
ncbi:MAG: c-type cytochrome [Wenzhouxiangella sp.]